MANDTEVVTEFHPEQTDADHDAWFRLKVQEGLREADDPKTVWVSNEDVFRKIDERLQTLHERTALKRAS
jgi:hypothetical protein